VKIFLMSVCYAILDIKGLPMNISGEDLDSLRSAKNTLENSSFGMKVVEKLNIPFNKGFDMLPDNWQGNILEVTQNSLEYALNAALITLDSKGTVAYPYWHKAAVMATGGVGGFFGIAALPIELPLSTTIMLRSIADIARTHGENLSTDASKLACLEVLAFGGLKKTDDNAFSAYYATRVELSKSVEEAINWFAKGQVDNVAPKLVNLISKIASRFSVQVSEEAVAMAVPVIATVSGALINLMFMDHFQSMAFGHFTVRKIERKYGYEAVRKSYEDL